jgi:hypothetical protein
MYCCQACTLNLTLLLYRHHKWSKNILSKFTFLLSPHRRNYFPQLLLSYLVSGLGLRVYWRLTVYYTYAHGLIESLRGIQKPVQVVRKLKPSPGFVYFYSTKRRSCESPKHQHHYTLQNPHRCKKTDPRINLNQKVFRWRIADSSYNQKQTYCWNKTVWK